MTRPVRPLMGVNNLRYECMGCTLSYATEKEAYECECAHLEARYQRAADIPVDEFSPPVAYDQMSDHAAACHEMLSKVLHRLAMRASPEDIGPEVILIGRMMARMMARKI